MRIFEGQHFIAYLLGIAILMAGFEAAQSVCAGASGTINSMLGKARGAMQGAVAMGAGAATAVGMWGVRKGAKYTGKGMLLAGGYGKSKFMGTKVGAWMDPRNRQQNEMTALKTKLENAATPEKAAKYQSKISKLQGKLSESYKGTVIKEAGEGTAAQMAYLQKAGSNALAGITPPQLGDQKFATIQAFATAMGSADAMKKLGPERAKALYEAYNKNGEMEAALGGDEKMAENIKNFKKANPHITGKIDDIEFDNVKELTNDAIRDEKVQDRLKLLVDNKGFNVFKNIAEGKMGNARMKALTEGQAGKLAEMSGDQMLDASEAQLAAGLSAAILAKQTEPIKQKIIAKLAESDNAEVWGKMNQEIYVEVTKAAGIDIKNGTIVDQKKLEEAIVKNPTLLAQLKPADVNKLRQDIIVNLNPGTMQKMVQQIKVNPTSEVNVKLRNRLGGFVSEAQKSGVQNNDMTYFSEQMAVIDKSLSKKAGKAEKQTAKRTEREAKSQNKLQDLQERLQDTQERFNELQHRLASGGEAYQSVEVRTDLEQQKNKLVNQEIELEKQIELLEKSLKSSSGNPPPSTPSSTSA